MQEWGFPPYISANEAVVRSLSLCCDEQKTRLAVISDAQPSSGESNSTACL